MQVTSETKPKAPAKKPKSKQLSASEREKLFNKYIVPNFAFIKSLTKQYTNNYQDIEDNYNEILEQFFNYIGTYNPEQKLDTWIHYCVRNACYAANKKRYKESSHWTDIEMCSMDDLYGPGTSMITEAKVGTLLDNLSDETLAALMSIPPLRLSPFMLYVQGLKIREITAAEWKMGHLEKRSEDIVKSRIYWAKRELQYLLRKYGITRENY